VRGRLRRVAAAGGHLRVTTAFAIGQLAHRQAGVVTIQHFDRAGASLGHATNRPRGTFGERVSPIGRRYDGAQRTPDRSTRTRSYIGLSFTR
jgi:hypothetical protein